MLTVLLTSPRVAPGVLTWDAWSALRGASRVLAGSGSGFGGHPQVAALTAAGVAVEVVDVPSGASGVDGLAALLSSAVASAAGSGSVVWLAAPGDAVDPALLDALLVPFSVLNGSADLPGAHLLDLVAITDRLRVSCPWDREQTHTSLLRYLIEEAYEAAETIEDGDLGALREEIGDVLFQVFFHARIASELPSLDGGFTIDDVADTLAAKLIRRHPHVFGSVAVSSASEVNANWEAIKKAERAEKAASGGGGGGAGVASALDGVPFGQPALSLAAQLMRRAERAGVFVPVDAVGVDGPDGGSGSSGLTGERVGAELMALVARAQAAGFDPELELRAAARRFADEVRDSEREGHQ